MTLRVLDQPRVPPRCTWKAHAAAGGPDGPDRRSRCCQPTSSPTGRTPTATASTTRPVAPDSAAMASRRPVRTPSGPGDDRARPTAVARQVITVSQRRRNLGAAAAIYGSASGRRGRCDRASARSAASRTGRITATAWDLEGRGGVRRLDRRVRVDEFRDRWSALRRRARDEQQSAGGDQHPGDRDPRPEPAGPTSRSAGAVDRRRVAAHGRRNPGSLYASSYGTNDDAIVAWAWDTDDDGDFDDGTETSKLVTFSAPGVRGSDLQGHGRGRARRDLDAARRGVRRRPPDCSRRCCSCCSCPPSPEPGVPR